MTTVSYEVIDELSAPKDFMEAAYTTLQAGSKQIHIVARRISADDLATRRGDISAQIEFDFNIVMLDHADAKIPNVSGYMATEGERGEWIDIAADMEHNHVRFNTFSE